jgi:hypothetical protein
LKAAGSIWSVRFRHPANTTAGEWYSLSLMKVKELIFNGIPGLLG